MIYNTWPRSTYVLSLGKTDVSILYVHMFMHAKRVLTRTRVIVKVSGNIPHVFLIFLHVHTYIHTYSCTCGNSSAAVILSVSVLVHTRES